MHHVRRLPLEGLYNARDLGGYAAAGGVTRFGVYVRCEAPCGLPEATVRALRDYGIRTAVDLRSLEETETRPSDLRAAMECLSCPQDGDDETFRSSRHVDWQAVYIRRCEDSRPWVRRALELAARREGGVLFHCTTGKDRTGLIACFLLAIAGVSPADIVADYCVSEVYLQPVFEAMRSGALTLRPGGPPAYDPSVFHTPPSAMAGLLAYLETRYGSVPGYLLDAGVPAEVLAAIREKFVAP